MAVAKLAALIAEETECEGNGQRRHTNRWRRRLQHLGEIPPDEISAVSRSSGLEYLAARAR
jgi:hypothetical protein